MQRELMATCGMAAYPGLPVTRPITDDGVTYAQQDARTRAARRLVSQGVLRTHRVLVDGSWRLYGYRMDDHVS